MSTKCVDPETALLKQLLSHSYDVDGSNTHRTHFVDNICGVHFYVIVVH
jgi:hypothetical protein